MPWQASEPGLDGVHGLSDAGEVPALDGLFHEPQPFSQLIARSAEPLKLIAHCLESPRATVTLAGVVREQTAPAPGTLILIGPEGDFSPGEVETALSAGYLPVSLGQNRLRTETAGVVAATLLCIK